ncbi:hypothetical protein [Streptomyces mirabilis]
MVRFLRHVFTVEVEDRADYLSLLEGAWALERMRINDPARRDHHLTFPVLDYIRGSAQRAWVRKTGVSRSSVARDYWDLLHSAGSYVQIPGQELHTLDLFLSQLSRGQVLPVAPVPRPPLPVDDITMSDPLDVLAAGTAATRTGSTRGREPHEGIRAGTAEDRRPSGTTPKGEHPRAFPYFHAQPDATSDLGRLPADRRRARQTAFEPDKEPRTWGDRSAPLAEAIRPPVRDGQGRASAAADHVALHRLPAAGTEAAVRASAERQAPADRYVVEGPAEDRAAGHGDRTPEEPARQPPRTADEEPQAVRGPAAASRSAGPALEQAVSGSEQAEEPAGASDAVEAGQRHPWYLDHAALGHASVTGAGTFTADDAHEWARRIATALPDKKSAGAIENALRTMLATTTPPAWDDLLAYGVTLSAGGRVVWLHPVLADLRPVPVEEQPAGEVREYSVRFATTAASGQHARTRQRGADSALLLGFNTGSAVASAMVLGLPQLRFEASVKTGRAQRSNIIASRTLFIGANRSFSAGVRVRVFVDGAERTPELTVARDLRVEFPAEYAGADRPQLGVSPAAVRPPAAERPYGTTPVPPQPVLNAVGISPLVAAVHRRLWEARLPVATIARVMDQATRQMLNERTARSRSRWWLTSGDISGLIEAPTFRGRSFQGRLGVRAEIVGLEFVELTEKVQVRQDLGRGVARGVELGGSSSAGISFGYNAYGFAMPVTDSGPGAVKGLLPLLGVGLDRGTSGGLTTISQALNHTVLNFEEDQARYRAQLRITVDIGSTTHPRIAPVSEVVEAEIGVPWRDGRGAEDFEEQVLGDEGRAPGARPPEPRVLPGPVSSRPYVRALLRESGTEPVRSMGLPERLVVGRRGTPHPGEPLALAARRGQGFAMALAMPGSEAVQDQLSWALRQFVPQAVRRSADWTAVDGELGLHFGRPALEADLPALLAGVSHTVGVGGRRYRLTAQAVLLDRVGGSSYSMTVNARASRSETVTSEESSEWSVTAGAGGGALLPFGDGNRLRVGGLTLRGAFGRSRGEQFKKVNTAYRRIENEGAVDEHDYETVYKLSVGPERPDPSRPAENWWISRPGELVTQVVVPRQHAPATPLDAALVAQAGRPMYARDWPAAPRGQVDFTRGGTGGVYPAFLVMPELTRLAADGYARLAGLPGQWTAEPANWPEQLMEMTEPTKLAARLGALTGPDGYEVALPDRDGRRYLVRLRLRAYAPRDLGPTAGETEIEQYAQAAFQHGRSRTTQWSVGLSVNIGPQIGVGALAGGGRHDSAAVPVSQEGDQSHTGGGHQRGAGLRAVAVAQAETEWSWATARNRIEGEVRITRATYKGVPHVIQADPVFEVTVVRSKGSRREESVRYIQVSHGLDLLVPERRVEDLLPPVPVPVPREVPFPVSAPGPVPVPALVPEPKAPRERDALREQVLQPVSRPRPSPIPAHASAGADAFAPGAVGSPPLARTHLVGRPLAGAVHPELLRADHVRETIVGRLEERGALPPRGRARDQLLEALRVFSSDALQGQFTALTGTGVSHWFPLGGPFGTTRYVWVGVTADVAAPHSHRPRPEIKLTLRSEALTVDKQGRERSFQTGAGLSVRTRIGDHEGHGGTEVEASYGVSRERSHEVAGQTLDISRANTRETSEEFEHRLTFRIAMGATTKPPAALSVPMDGVRALTLRAASLLRDGGATARWWDSRRAWTWTDDGLGEDRAVSGDVRLLVPTHMTDLAEQPVLPVSAPVRPGGVPSWTAPAGRAPELPAALTEFIHPWEVPAASVVQRWAKVAAVPAVREPDLARDGAWEVPGPDFATVAGMSYEHHTSSGMLQANVVDLLKHRYRVPVAGRTVTVGFELTAAEVVGPAEGVVFKARRYQQEHAGPKTEHGNSRGGVVALGPEAGGATDGLRVYDRLTADVYGVRTVGKQAFEVGETHESNKEATRRYRHYRFDVTVVIQLAHGARRALRVPVPGGLYAMLPLDADGHLAGGLEQSLHRLFPLPWTVPRAPDGARPVPGETQARTDEDAGTGVRTAADKGRAVGPEREPWQEVAPRSEEEAQAWQEPDAVPASLPRTRARDAQAQEAVRTRGGSAAVRTAQQPADAAPGPSDGRVGPPAPAPRALAAPAESSASAVAGDTVGAGEQVPADERTADEEHVRIEKLLEGSRTAWYGDRPLAVWLPGADAGLDGATLERLSDLVPENTVLVFSEQDADGGVTAGGRSVSAAGLAGLLSAAVPGRAPLLAMPGADRLGPALAEALGTPVIASAHGMVLDPAVGTLGEAAPPGTTGDQPPGFRLFDAEHPQGETVFRERSTTPWTPTPDGPGQAREAVSGDPGRPSPDGPGQEPGPPPGEPVTVDPSARTIGIPRAGLPYLPEVIRTLRELTEQAGRSVPEAVWDLLPQRLLSNYRYLVPGEGEGGANAGLMVPLGGVEALVTLDPQDPRLVRHPAGSYDRPSALEPVAQEVESGAGADRFPADGPLGLVPARNGAPERFHANEAINASYLTGAFVRTHSGSTGATRGAISLAYGIGISPGTLQAARVGVGISGMANASSRSTSWVGDAEGGHVEVAKADSTMVAYRPVWSLRIRNDTRRGWNDVDPVVVAAEGEQRLLLYVPEHYLEQALRQITAVGTGGLEHRLPAVHYASGLTGLPALFDRIAAAARRQGLELAIGSPTRDELLQKLWNLESHLDEAIGDESGYAFTLHHRDGSPAATIQVHTARSSRGTRVGATSDKAPIENVRTAVDGTSGTHTVSHSTTLTAPSAELGLLPLPFTDPALGLGVSASLGMTWSHTDGISAGRTGLWVVVPRYVGHTVAYRLEFTHSAVVAVRGAGPVRTPAVLGQGLVRMPEPDAFRYGFPVDEEALREPAVTENGPSARVTGPRAPYGVQQAPEPATTVHEGPLGRTVRYAPGLLRGTGRRPGDLEHLDVPPHVAEGRGIGMGLVDVDEDTVRELHRRLAEELHRLGFLTDDRMAPLAESRWWSHASLLDSRLENHELLDKYISRRGLESHYDQLHQSGLVFTMFRRRGALGVDLDTDAVRITVKAVASPNLPPRFEGSAEDMTLVNLAMGMNTAGQFSAGSRRIALAVRFRTLFQQLRGSVTGFDLLRSVGGTDAVSYLNNRPELLEYSGTTNRHALFSDYTVTLELQHSGLQGGIRPGTRDPEPISLHGQRAVAYLLPLGDPPQPVAVSPHPTPPSVLDRAVIYHVDATGLRDAATAALGELTGPQGQADQELSSFTSTIQVRAHLKEIVHGRYTTDQFFDSGWLRDTFGALDVRGSMGPSEFVDAIDDPFVLGVITLWMSRTSSTDTSSVGLRWAQADLTVGGPTPDGVGYLQGGADALRGWQWNSGVGRGQTGGKEEIKLDFNRAYLYRTAVDFAVTGRLEKHAKLLPDTHRADLRTVTGRTVLYALSEPEALQQYAADVLPVADAQLVDVMNRWHAGEVRLSGTTVAGVLSRWTRDVPGGPRPLTRAAQAVTDTLAGLTAGLPELAARLARLHDTGALTVLDKLTRAAFNERFGLDLKDPGRGFPEVVPAEYLTRRDPGGRILGHSGVHALSYEDGRSTYDIVREQVDRVAPGLLASRPELWTGDGRRIGRLQGSVNVLQSLLAEGRDLAMWEDLLSPNGHTFYLVNPVGWLLSDVVEITLRDTLDAGPEVLDFRPGTGVENYGHGYVSTSTTTSRDASQTFTVAKVGGVEANTAASGAVGFGEGRHRGVTRGETAITEQTAYAWEGTYRIRLRHTLTVEARRLDMANRPLNNALTGLYRALDANRSTPAVARVPGLIDLQVPRGLAEFHPLYGPSPARDLRPLPELPGDAYVVGALMDDGLPAALELMTRLFGREADGARTRTSLTIRQLMSRSHLANHLLQASAGRRHLLNGMLFVPGHSSERAELYLTGDLFDLEVLGPVSGTGSGRYTKHESGTTADTSNNRWRPAASAGTGVVHSHDPAQSPDGHVYPSYTGEGSTAVSRSTGSGLAGAGTENYRREQHIKQQGPIHLVRVSGRYRLVAERHTRNLLWPTASRRDTLRSAPFTGDVYVMLFKAEVDELRARMEQAPAPRDGDADWAVLDGARPFDLTALIEQAADEPGTGAARLHQSVARRIKDGTAGLLDAVVLHLDQGALTERAHRAVLRWAADTMRADLAEARAVDPGAAVPRSLTRYQDLLAGRPAEPSPGDGPEGIRAVVREANRVRDLLTADEGFVPAPVRLPEIVSLTAVSVDHLVRDLAHELDVPVRADVTGMDGRVSSRWADPSGRVHAYNPLAPGTLGLTSAQAEAAGLLTAAVRADADRLGLDETELSEIYQTSWQRRQTFDQAVQAEAGRRGTRLESLDPRLPGLFRRARTASDGRAEPDTAGATADARQVLHALRALARDTGDVPRERLAVLLSRADALLALRPAGAPDAPSTRDDDPDVPGDTEAPVGSDALAGADRERISLAFSLRREPGPAMVADLEHALLAAGSGARSLVVPEHPGPAYDGPLSAANVRGHVVWFDHGSRRMLLEAPQITGMVASIDLDAEGTLLRPVQELLDQGPEAIRFPQLALGADLARLLEIDEAPPRGTPVTAGHTTGPDPAGTVNAGRSAASASGTDGPDEVLRQRVQSPVATVVDSSHRPPGSYGAPRPDGVSVDRPDGPPSAAPDFYTPRPAGSATAVATLVMSPDMGAARPVAARNELARQITRVLHDPATAERVRASGARVLLVPRGVRPTDLPGYGGLRDLRTHGGAGQTRPAGEARGLTDVDARVVVVAEENLLGEDTGIDGLASHPDGYSSVLHELAHLVYFFGLDDADRQLVHAAHQARWDLGPDIEWADGPRLGTDGRPADNYASTGPEEYFAQTSTAYLGANRGHDPYTGRPRNNGAGWVWANDPALARLLARLYGPAPHTTPPGNPVAATRAEHDALAAASDLDRLNRTAPAARAEAAQATPVVPERATTQDRLGSTVTEFGTLRDGSQGLVHLDPVPEETVTWLQDQVFRQAEGDRGTDDSFRGAVRATLTSRLLSSEWARLFSEHGLPLRAAYRGDTHQVSLRLTLSDPRRVSPGIEEMPDGPPVTIQRWVFGVSEAGNTGSIGDLRSLSLGYAHTRLLASAAGFRRLTLTPQLTVTHNQTTTSVAVGATVQPMVLLRSRERSWPFEYAMHWQLRTTASLAHAATTTPPDGQWHTLAPAPTPLTVWFPKHLAEDEPDPAALTDDDPEKRPAPMETLLGRVPLFATESVPRADEFLSDVLLSFQRDLKDISEASLEELRDFLGEGNLRGHLPLVYGGHHTSPTLFAKDGSVIGMLRLHADLAQRTGAGALAGPPTHNSVLESHVLRSVRMSGSAAVTNAVGVGLGVSAGFAAGMADPATGTEPLGFTLTGQGAVQRQVTHTLSSGGSARTSRALRTAKPLLRVHADAVYQVSLVRPDGPERGPAEGSPLARSTRYPLILRVPSAATVSGTPQASRHLPPEILHLRDLGVSATPLAVEGTRPLFDDLETWLRDHGFLPPSQDRAASWHQRLTNDAVHLQRLHNLRRLEQIRSAMGLRAGLDEMTAGGSPAWFELPTVAGTQRVSFRITVGRRYPADRPDGGVSHDLHLTGVQTLNYTGSTVSGDEQLTHVPWAVAGTLQGSLTTPFDGHGNLWLQGLSPEYAYSRQRTVVTGSSAGTGHEFYALSPTADGVQVHTLPVTYHTHMSFSHGRAMAPGRAEGHITLAVPTYRTLAEPTPEQEPTAVPQPSPRTEADADRPADSVRLPETAWLDRVEGSRALRDAVNQILGAADRPRETADGVEQARMPGAWPEPVTGNPKDPGENTVAGQDRGDSAPAGLPYRFTAGALDGVSRTVRMAGGALRWVGRLAAGERAADPESMAQEVVEAGLSPHHLTANAYRIFNDSYVVEGVATSGVLAGTDTIIEVEGHLTHVRAMPRPGVMDYERWIQSVDASADTRSSGRGHALGVTVAAEYSGRTFAPSGHYAHRSTITDATTVQDNSAVFRVTSENDVFAHRFTATAVYRVTVRAGLRNVVTGTVTDGPRFEDTRMVELPDAVEFMLSDNDLINHPEFLLDGVPEPARTVPLDRRLPAQFVASGGQIGFGSVVEVHSQDPDHPDGGRSAFQRTIHRLVEEIAPGTTVPGTSTYLPGVRSRINEHGSSLGLRTLVNAGPDGHTAFHFVHRSWLGPMLVEVAMRARPHEQDLAPVRGRRAVGNPGLDNVLGHSSGDGGSLPVSGSTRQTRTTTASDALDFSPLVQQDGYRFRTTMSVTRQTSVADGATSARERRAWQRSMMDVSEFDIRYRYEVTVSARPMRDVPTAVVPWLVAAGLASRVLSRLPGAVRVSLESLAGLLPRPVQQVSGTVTAQVVTHFNGSETSAGQPAPGALVIPAVHTADPARTPVPRSGETTVDMEIPTGLRALLSAEPWIPGRPFAVYDFDGLRQLGEALHAVDPSLGVERALPTSTSAEGMLVRLTQLAGTGRLTLLSPAATAPYLGQPGSVGTVMQLSLYAPHSEADSLDTAIDRVEISSDGASSQADLTMTSALNFGFSGPLGDARNDRLSMTAPLAGERATAGQTHTYAAPRREMLRFGTPTAGATRGARSHQVRAVGVLRVTGPNGTRWVVGTIVLRTTEAPPTPPALDIGTGSAAPGRQPPAADTSLTTVQDAAVTPIDVAASMTRETPERSVVDMPAPVASEAPEPAAVPEAGGSVDTASRPQPRTPGDDETAVLSGSAAAGPVELNAGLIARLDTVGSAMADRPAQVVRTRSIPVPVGVPIVSGGHGRSALGRDFRPDTARRLDVSTPIEAWTTYAAGPADGEGNRTFQRQQPPWYTLSFFAPVPYFVLVGGTHRAPWVRTADGTRRMQPAEFADHLASLPEVRRLSAGAPAVLVMSHGGAGGLELPRLIAARTSRTVWSHTGALEILPAPDGRSTRIAVEPGADGEGPGRWLRSLPDELGAASAEERRTVLPPKPAGLTTVDGGWILDSDVTHHTIQDAQHRPLGRASFRSQEWERSFQADAARLSAKRVFRSADYTARLNLLPEPGRPLPWTRAVPGTTPYFFVAHGGEDHVHLHLNSRAGDVRVDGTNLGQFLRRRPSLTRLPSDVPIVLAACRTGAVGERPDRMLSDVRFVHDGVIAGDAERHGEGPAGWVSGGAWC